MTALRVGVWRGGATGRLQSYEVPRYPSQTVLDVVTHIQRKLDPTLAYRYATARDVNRALRQLGFHGLVARVGRRGWRVADPFLSDALRSKPLVAW